MGGAGRGGAGQGAAGQGRGAAQGWCPGVTPSLLGTASPTRAGQDSIVDNSGVVGLLSGWPIPHWRVSGHKPVHVPRIGLHFLVNADPNPLSQAGGGVAGSRIISEEQFGWGVGGSWDSLALFPPSLICRQAESTQIRSWQKRKHFRASRRAHVRVEKIGSARLASQVPFWQYLGMSQGTFQHDPESP